jgi:PKD repeat protein
VTKTNYISVVYAPVANFVASNTTPYIGQTVTFTDQSTNAPTSWSWAFSPSTVTYTGGTSSTSQNPQVQFNAGGNYTVTLTATNGSGSDGETKTNYIAVYYAPVADFDADNYNPAIGNDVYFFDLSTNNPTSWSWSFSPATVTYMYGTSSASQEPVVRFNAGGAYTVTLTATNLSGSDGETKVNFINVIYPPVANFSASNTNPFINQTVTFTDLSTNSPSMWSWSFSPSTVTYQNGTNSTSQNPQVKFTVGGYYTVTLTATNASGSDGETKTNYISVVYAPVANFSAGNTTPFIGQTVNFTDLSSNNPTSWSWSFSPATVTYTGGTNSSSQNPQVQFTAGGNYTVTLTATNGSGSDGETKTNYIQVIYAPVANFSAGNTTPFIGQTVNFTDLSSNNPTSWSWSFSPATVTYTGGTNSSSQNPQVQFNAGGNYTVTLTATNGSGSDGETKTNYISVVYAPVADFSASTTNAYIGLTVTFTDLSSNNPTSWSWSFSPATVTYTGGTTSASQNPQVQFTAGGNYTVTLTATNGSGSDGETKTNYISVMYAPVADFVADNTSPEEGATVIFTDLSLYSPSVWSWSFTPATITYVGGTTSSSQNPQVQFNVAGNYTVSLIATNASGNDTETKTDYITVITLELNLDISLLLEGPFDGASMIPYLNGILPLSQPYNTAPWNYAGTESVVSIPNSNIVDWILVELRDAPDAASATGTTVIARQAAFLQNDGAVLGMDGLPGLHFTASVVNNLFVVVYHRNHLSIMSAAGLVKSGGVYTYDFSSGSGQVYGGTDGHKELPMGYWGMTGGDGDHNGMIGTTDYSPVWETEAGATGYLDSDYNLDLQSDNKDKDDIWTPNQGKGTQVPD